MLAHKKTYKRLKSFDMLLTVNNNIKIVSILKMEKNMQTERLIIDKMKDSDKSDYFENITHDKKVLETFMCNYTENIDELNFLPYIENEKIFAIRLKNTKKLIGIICYFSENEFSCEIGYAIGQTYWNKGYTTEAMKEFINFCFDKLCVKKIYASFFEGNTASERVMKKCDMKYDHYAEKELNYQGEDKNLIYYSVTR